MASCSAHKAGGRKKDGMFGVIAVIFRCHCHTWWSTACLEVAKHLPNIGKQQLLLICLQAHISFFPLYLRIFINPLYSSNSFPYPTGQEKKSGYVVLSCLQELTQSLCSLAEPCYIFPNTVLQGWLGKERIQNQIFNTINKQLSMPSTNQSTMLQCALLL